MVDPPPRVFGELQLTVKGIRGAQLGRSRPTAIEFHFGPDLRAVRVAAQNSHVGSTLQTLVFTPRWIQELDHVEMRAVMATSSDLDDGGTGRRGEIMGVASMLVGQALAKSPGKTATIWHCIGDGNGHTVAEVMASLRWLPKESSVVVHAWPPLTGVCKTVSDFYREARRVPSLKPLAQAAEILAAVTAGKVGAAVNAFEKASKDCCDWATGTVEYVKVGTASNANFLVGLVTQPFRSVVDMMWLQHKDRKQDYQQAAFD